MLNLMIPVRVRKANGSVVAYSIPRYNRSFPTKPVVVRKSRHFVAQPAQ